MDKLRLKKRKLPQTYKKQSYYRDEYFSVRKIAPQARTDYARSLLNPFLRLPVRIPDLSSYQTSIYTQESHVAWFPNGVTNNTNNNMFVVIVATTLQANPVYAVAQGENNIGQYGQITNAVTLKDVGFDKSANYKFARLVSAACKISYAGTDSQNQGTIRACTVAFPAALAATFVGSVFGTIEGFQQQQDFIQTPVINGCIARYAPRDSEDFQMRPVVATGSTTIANYTRPFMFVFEAVNTAAGVPLHVDITCNFEALAGANATIPESARGPCDPQSTGMGMEMAGSLPGVFSAADDQVEMYVDSPVKFLSSL